MQFDGVGDRKECHVISVVEICFEREVNVGMIKNRGINARSRGTGYK